MLLKLIQKEFTLELRRKSVISGIGLYMLSLIFICYLTFALRKNSISEATWSALFWLAILFSVINSVAKSFIGEKKGLQCTIIRRKPQAIIFPRTSTMHCCIVLSVVGFLLFRSSSTLFRTPLFC